MIKKGNTPYQHLYNRDMPMPAGSFIAYYTYKPAEQALYITIRKGGKQFRYDGIEPKEFHAIIDTVNRSQALRKIMKEKMCEFVATIEPEQIQLITMPRKQFNYLAR